MKNSIRTIARGMFLLGALTVFSIACSKDDMNDTNSDNGNNGNGGGTPGATEVLIQDMAFDPATITIKAGATIKWTNKDAVAHTASSDSSVFESGSIASGASFSYVFSTPGTYPYHCTPHPSMTATVVVTE
jgi:plastocyanin